jgi:hypothetical protein
MGGGGGERGLQRPVLPVNEPEKIGAHKTRARSSAKTFESTKILKSSVFANILLQVCTATEQECMLTPTYINEKGHRIFEAKYNDESSSCSSVSMFFIFICCQV